MLFFLLGLCKGSLFDTKYSWTRDTAGDFYVFSGYKNAVLRYHPEESLWRIDLHSTDDTYAVANTTDYPLGQKEWTVHNDACFGDRTETVVTVLNLNSCNESEFNCADGQCVPMEGRCNGVLDCGDSTGQIHKVGISLKY